MWRENNEGIDVGPALLPLACIAIVRQEPGGNGIDYKKAILRMYDMEVGTGRIIIGTDRDLSLQGNGPSIKIKLLNTASIPAFSLCLFYLILSLHSL